MTRREDPELRKEVLKRDKNTCKLCNKKFKKRWLQVHHIFMWSKAVHMRFDSTNCISLCWKCHKEIKGKEHLYQRYFLEVLNGYRKNP